MQIWTLIIWQWKTKIWQIIFFYNFLGNGVCPTNGNQKQKGGLKSVTGKKGSPIWSQKKKGVLDMVPEKNGVSNMVPEEKGSQICSQKKKGWLKNWVGNILLGQFWDDLSPSLLRNLMNFLLLSSDPWKSPKHSRLQLFGTALVKPLNLMFYHLTLSMVLICY